MPDFTQGIVKKLRSYFPEGQYRIYIEAVEQGLQEPCFFVSQITHEQGQALGARYQERQTFVIQYFPENTQKKRACRKIEIVLFDILEFIQMGDRLFRGTNRRGEIQDGILSFFVDFSYSILKPKKEAEWMQEVQINGKIRK